MSTKSDGMNYVPEGGAERVVDAGEFVFAAAHLDHGHINAQATGLIQAGGVLKYVYDPDAAKVTAFREQFPDVTPVSSLDEILDDDGVHLVAAAAIPCDRGPIGVKVMDGGKDYFTDKAPFTTMGQLEDARAAVTRTGRRFFVYFSERLHNESAYRAGELIHEGAIGRVLQVLGIAPHRLAKPTRPDWFFRKRQYGGIITDIGSHQFEQFLHYASATDATVNFARVANLANPDVPELEDFGEASLTTDNGASCYLRVDWFTPDGQSVWGDGRTFVLGEKGTMELRKYTDVARDSSGDIIFLCDADGEREIPCSGRVGFPFFGQVILDSLNGTEDAMTQDHIFKAAELSLRAQAFADAAQV